MRSLFGVVLFLLFSATAAALEDGIPLETMQKIKDATVYVKVDYSGMSATGSGFVIKVDGNTALIVTNNHVVASEKHETIKNGRVNVQRRRPPPGPRSPEIGTLVVAQSVENPKVTIVLHSGAPNERSIAGEVLAADPDLDLAVVKISHVKRLPSPIDYSHEPKLVETMPVYVFGFPFGELLDASRGNPAITVGKGSISSLRLDDAGQLTRVQIDGGAINPGNSGGPVVDGHGRLIGVVVSGFRGSGISFIIPTRHLSLMLQGRLGKPQLTSSRDDDGQLVIHVEIPLIDPLKKIQSVALYYMSPSLADKPPQPSARLAQLKGVSKLPLEIKDQVASGKFSPHKGATEFKLLYQASCTTSDGKEGLSKNMTQTIGLSPAHVPANQGDEPTPVGPAHHDTPGAKETRIMGGAVGKRFSDEAPPGGVLIGFEVGLGKLDENDVVHTIRPIFRIANGREVLGEQHGTDTSRLIVVKAKKGYAVGGITAKSTTLLYGFSVTFMKVGKKGLDRRDHYQSDWVAGKGGGPPTLLGGDGMLVIGIVGREKADICTAMGLLRKR